MGANRHPEGLVVIDEIVGEMSDTAQGPGWWQASDGKWYAPELHPGPRPESSDTAQGPGWWRASDGRWYPPELHPGPRPAGRRAPGRPSPGLVAGLVVVMVVVIVVVTVVLSTSSPSKKATATTTTTTAAAHPTTTTTTLGASSATALYHEMTVAMLELATFHVATTNVLPQTSGKTMTVTTVGDAASTSGSQVIATGQARLLAVVVGPTTYAEGNAPALTTFLHLGAATAAANAGKWISLVQGNAPFSSVTSGVTVGSLLHNLAFIPTSTTPGPSGTTILLGTLPSTVGEAGSTVSTVVNSTNHLPLSETIHAVEAAGTTTNIVVFSKYGEPVDVAAPPSPIPYASLAAG